MISRPFCAVCARLHIAGFATRHGRHHGIFHRLTVSLCAAVLLECSVLLRHRRHSLIRGRGNVSSHLSLHQIVVF